VAGVARFVASSLAPAAQRFAPTAAGGVLRQILEVAIDGYQRSPARSGLRTPSWSVAAAMSRTRSRL